MYKKKPEQFTAFDDESNPDTSKEREKSDREKFVAAIRLWGEATKLWRQKTAELTTSIEDLLDANTRRDHTELARRINDLAKLNLDQHDILENQYEKGANLFPDELPDMKKAIEKHKQGETQTDNDKRDTLKSLDDDELKNFTV